jgi:hypothetical protein
MILPILSEYVYRYLHKQLELNKITKDELKAFRKTDKYKEIVDYISADVKEILDLVKCCNSNFEHDSVYEFLNKFIQCTLDFNDVIIEDFCELNELTLVTNDGDFKNCNIPILTSNPNLYS